MNDLARTDVTPFPKPTKAVRDRLPLRAKPKAAAASVKDERAAWYAAVMGKRNSVIWTAEDYPVIAAGNKPPIQAHHVVPRSICRKHGAPEWDARNGMAVSTRRHARHHSRHEPITLGELPDEVHAFIADHPDLLPYLERTYKPEHSGG